jgi:hypothetical protein
MKKNDMCKQSYRLTVVLVLFQKMVKYNLYKALQMKLSSVKLSTLFKSDNKLLFGCLISPGIRRRRRGEGVYYYPPPPSDAIIRSEGLISAKLTSVSHLEN